MTFAAESHVAILRHAHSSWALPGQRDHQRELDERGRSESAKLAGWIANAGLGIDRVICSTAHRATETLELVRASLAGSPAIELSDGLYALGVEAYFAALRQTGAPDSIMIVGHNPMIQEFALSLCGSGEPEALEMLRKSLPTAGLALVEFATPLQNVEAGDGRLVRLVLPSALA